MIRPHIELLGFLAAKDTKLFSGVRMITGISRMLNRAGTMDYSGSPCPREFMRAQKAKKMGRRKDRKSKGR